MENQNLSRRRFIQHSTTLLGGAFLAPALLTDAAKKKNGLTCLQLYSVRDDMKSDAKGTLEKLAKLGFKNLEHAAYTGMHPGAYATRKIYGYSSKDFKKIMDDLGLTMPTSHVVFSMKHWDAAKNDMEDIWKYVMEDALNMGQTHIISPWFDSDHTKLDEVKKGIEVYNKVGMICTKAGLRFGFHNHHQEFTQMFDGNYLYDIMLDGLDLKYVFQQLDIGNLAVAKVDPMRWLKKYPKHFESMHVKDKDKTKDESTLLGDGCINLTEVLQFARKKTNIKHWVLEQESYGDKTAMECVKINLDRFNTTYKFA
jgi:sugar phosphate isomerase/epimerase